MGAKVKWRADREAWYVYVDHEGRSTKKRIGENREEAEAAAVAINSEIAALQRLDAACAIEFQSGEPINGEDALSWWRANFPYKASTSATIDSHVREHLLPFLRNRDLRLLTKRDLREFVQSEFARGCSEATVRNVVSSLRRLLNVLVDGEYLPSNPLPKCMSIVNEIARAHPESRSLSNRDAWTEVELNTLMRVARERESEWFPTLFLLCETGMRVSEAIGLKWEAVDLEGRSIHVREAVVKRETGPPKWGRKRHVPICEPLLDMLRKLALERGLKRRTADPDYVLLSPMGRRIDQRNLSRAWMRIRSWAHSKYQVRPLVLHSFRHTWATQMIRRGEDPQVVAQALGDRIETVLKHYSHVLPGRGAFSSLTSLSHSTSGTPVRPQPAQAPSLGAGRGRGSQRSA